MANAVSGVRRSFRELVDGTIRVQIDIDPTFNREFLELFGEIDMGVALAPLKLGPQKSKPESSPIGALCRLAVMWCSDAEFRKWLSPDSVINEDGAAKRIKEICKVESRKDLDTDKEAAERFHTLIRDPYRHYCESLS